MPATGLDVIDKTVQETNSFLRVVMDELGTDSRHVAFGALRATLHALRDRLEMHSSVHFAAQLPILLRGVYYEGWHPGRQTRERRADDFLDHVATELPPQLRDDAEAACMAALAAISERMDGEETEKIINQLPKELHRLWPGDWAGVND